MLKLIIKNIPVPLFAMNFLDPSRTLYLKPVFIMHYKRVSNALSMSCIAPYNALHDFMSKCSYSCTTLQYLIFYLHL